MDDLIRNTDLLEREMSWEGFGWPRWNLAAPLLPIAALHIALWERTVEYQQWWNMYTWDRAKADGGPVSPSWLPEYALRYRVEKFLGSMDGNRLPVLQDFDGGIRTFCTRFLDMRVGGDPWDWPFWTFGSLLEAACELTGDPEPVMPDPSLVLGDDGKPRWPLQPLAPEWPYRWLRQRKAAISLLRWSLRPAKCRYKMYSGDVHTGIPSSPQEAYEAALRDLEVPAQRDWTGTRMHSYVRLIYGPDHGWREGSYCCDIYDTRAVLPPKNLAGFVMLEAVSPTGNPDDFDGVGVLRPGRNPLGEGLEFPPLAIPLPPTPVDGRMECRGWQADAWEFHDCAGLFHFA